MLTRTLKMTFWVFYDHLGKMIAGSTLCSLVALALLSAAYVAALVVGPAGMMLGLAIAALTLAVALPIFAAGFAVVRCSSVK